jgi:hypothetical protein
VKSKNLVRVFVVLLLSAGLANSPTPIPATADSCLSDWPTNIFANGYGGVAYMGSSNSPIHVAIAPLVSQEVRDKIALLKNNIVVTYSTEILNGLDTDYGGTDPAGRRGLTFFADPNKRDFIDRLGWILEPYESRVFTMTPGASIFTTLKVSTPNCPDKIFKSGTETVPEYVIPSIQDQTSQDYLSSILFTTADTIRNLSTQLDGSNLELRQDLTFDSWAITNSQNSVNLVVDWRKCVGVEQYVVPGQGPNLVTVKRFRLVNTNQALDCKVPMYLPNWSTGELRFVIANTHFTYKPKTGVTPSKPTPLPSSNVSQSAKTEPKSKKLSWKCKKGKTILSFSGASIVCPTGYKKI